MRFLRTLRDSRPDMPVRKTCHSQSARRTEKEEHLSDVLAVRYPASRRHSSVPTLRSARPPWNRDTRFTPSHDDPLRKCLEENLRRRGFDEHYDAAADRLATLHELELARIKDRITQRSIEARHAAIGKFFDDEQLKFFEEEQTARRFLQKTEASSRHRWMMERLRDSIQVLEATEFAERRRLFRSSMAELEELKCNEQELAMDIVEFEAEKRQREKEMIRRQRAAELARQRKEHEQREMYNLIREEIHLRDQLHQRCAQVLAGVQRNEAMEREQLLVLEIRSALLYEESLQRHFITKVSDERMGAILEEHRESTLRIRRHLLQTETDRQLRDVAVKAEAAEKNRRAEEDRVRGEIKAEQERLAREREKRKKEMEVEEVKFQQELELRQLQLREEHDKMERLEQGRRHKLREDQTLERRRHEAVAEEAEQKGKDREQREKEAVVGQRTREGQHSLAKTEELLRLRKKVELENKPFLGITLAERVEPTAALVVDSLYVGGPADIGGVRLGDIFMDIEGTTVRNFVEMRGAMRAHARMGHFVTVRILRGEELVECKISVLTAEAQYRELADIFFDTQLHDKIQRQSTPSRGSRDSSEETSPNSTYMNVSSSSASKVKNEMELPPMPLPFSPQKSPSQRSQKSGSPQRPSLIPILH
jgi:hypothetical protein